MANTTNTLATNAGNFANGAFVEANTVAVFANGAYATSNAAYNQANNEPIGTSAGVFANGAYSLANTNTGNITNIQGVDVTQNTNISTAQSTATNAGVFANGAYLTSNAAFVVANSAYNQANNAGSFANSAFAKANSIISPTYYTGTTPPSSPSTSAIWYNTSNDVMYEYITSDGTNYYWVDIDSPTVAVGNTTISYTYTGYGRSAAMAMVFGGF